jgi:hypothetical protein
VGTLHSRVLGIVRQDPFYFFTYGCLYIHSRLSYVYNGVSGTCFTMDDTKIGRMKDA